MVSFKRDDIFKSECVAIVNPVNTVGVMEKGLTLAFKNKFPKNFIEYKNACDKGILRIGNCFCTIEGNKIIVNFATKTHWKYPSKLEYIEAGLIDLREFLLIHNISSIAIPPLGCGLEELDPKDVFELIEKYLGNLNTKVIVYIL